ncbi:guanidinopropionase [Modicisalibacter ilicicola DSM 19980]|uniref:Guanidinopropionase n=1 Tax=Modicisalibacter ilicicola DSM 19980 TaxID=1121942 RepID=A0A1M4W6D6_9GAMM|nr:agmatinase [Halomonas ilicicola]SHE76786.1 guanidinopropionase [Halomonas ilicicola DSM 19980]
MAHDDSYFRPLGGSELPRFAGRSTFMRLPLIDDPSEVDIALIGLPWDSGSTNRAGQRHGPREIRNNSTMMRLVHQASRIAPYDLCRIADLGDVPVNPIDIRDTLERATAFYRRVHQAGAAPLTAGGDHLGTLPILRGLARDEPMALVQFDAHSDTNDTYFGDNPYTHGTPFRRAIEEGLLDPRRIIQIGIRGSLYEASDLDWAHEQGIRVLEIEEYFDLGPDKVVEEIWRVVGDTPTYVTFDIDALDPVYAPGTGTPEIGGYSTREAQRMIRGLRGLNLVGADVMEVAPPFDSSGITALAGASLMFELLCVLADAVAKRR